MVVSLGGLHHLDDLGLGGAHGLELHHVGVAGGDGDGGGGLVGGGPGLVGGGAQRGDIVVFLERGNLQ